MASSSSFNSASCCLESSTSSHHDDIGPSSAKGLGICRNRQSLSMQAPCGFEMHRSIQDPQAAPLASRSRNGMVISGFAMAASTAVGLSVFAFDGLAMASDQDVNGTTIESVVHVTGSRDQKTGSSQSPENGKNAPDPSITLSPASNISFSIAIPIPHEHEWLIVRNGYAAPLPRTRRHEDAGLKCPQWTPSELEMFLPDFNGRPKPFPRHGHHWTASFVLRGMHDEAFLQLTELRDDVGDGASVPEEIPLPARGEFNKRTEGRLSLLKMLGMEKFTCFSM